MTMVILGFLVAMALFFAVGVASVRFAEEQVSDYLVAGRSVSPWAAGLSAAASNNSGFMFIGAIGFTYTYGLAAFWLFFAWIAGDYLSWLIVHRRLRERSEAQNNDSIAGFLSHDGTGQTRSLQVVLGALTVVFLTLYAAAQLKAGDKALSSTLKWSPGAGIWLGALMVAVYSFAGGIRASIWTDIAQSVVMLISMGALVGVCHLDVAPVAELSERLAQIDPALLNWTPSDASLGLFPYALGWFVAGFGGVGQPHMIVRAMTVSTPDEIPTMRRVYFSWYILFSVFTMAVGLYARVFFTDAAAFDKETALPLLTSAHLAPIWVGFVLAGIFAATMSTADSQVLASSASLTQDIFSARRDSYAASKTATMVVVTVATLAAFVGPDSVFDLVTIAWGLMTTCFAPLMVARVCGWRVTTGGYLLAAGLGMLAMLGWSHGLGLGDAMYDGAVGFLVAMPILAAAHVRSA